MPEVDELRFAGLADEVAFLATCLQAGTLDEARLQVAVLCGHPAAAALWRATGRTGSSRIKRRATVLVRRLYTVSPQWGTAAATEALRAALRWTSPSIADAGRANAGITLENLETALGQDTVEAFWQAIPYSQPENEPYWALEKAAVALWRSVLTPSPEWVDACVVLCLKGWQETHFPIVDALDGDRELFWAISEALTAEALGYRPASWRRPPGKAARWRIWQEEGGGHGDLYELEKTTYFHVVDWQRKTVAVTFTQEMSADFDGGLWTNYSYGGVKAVTVMPSGKLRVRYWSGTEEVLDPGAGSPSP